MTNFVVIWKGKVINPLFFLFAFLKLLNTVHVTNSIAKRCNSILSGFHFHILQKRMDAVNT